MWAKLEAFVKDYLRALSDESLCKDEADRRDGTAKEKETSYPCLTDKIASVRETSPAGDTAVEPQKWAAEDPESKDNPPATDASSTHTKLLTKGESPLNLCEVQDASASSSDSPRAILTPASIDDGSEGIEKQCIEEKAAARLIR
ncbi:hypothetical protein LTR28_004012 [Elasticomyces elasticus]|nr:hypothetical protein LTR28_004012 [Elasticomyces elasticus]